MENSVNLQPENFYDTNNYGILKPFEERQEIFNQYVKVGKKV